MYCKNSCPAPISWRESTFFPTLLPISTGAHNMAKSFMKSQPKSSQTKELILSCELIFSCVHGKTRSLCYEHLIFLLHTWKRVQNKLQNNQQQKIVEHLDWRYSNWALVRLYSVFNGSEIRNEPWLLRLPCSGNPITKKIFPNSNHFNIQNTAFKKL